MNANMNTRKDLVLLETPITEFNEKFNILAIQKLAFNFPHVRILCTHNCVRERCEEFKRRGELQDVLCFRDYSDR